MHGSLTAGSGADGLVVQHGAETSGFIFSKSALSPRFRLPTHAHRRATLLIVLGGEYVETAEGRTHGHPAMTAIIKPPGQEHSNEQRGRGASCVAIEVHDRRLDALRQHADLLQRRVVVRCEAIGAFALRAARELAGPDDFTALSLEGLALEILAEASRRERSAAERPHRPWLEDVRRMLDAPAASPSLSAIADDVGLHPVYVARAFRRHFGCTMGEYARRRRIERAQTALGESDEDLVTLALRLGFCDQSHFSKTFRRYTGMSPGEFRKRVTAARSG